MRASGASAARNPPATAPPSRQILPSTGNRIAAASTSSTRASTISTSGAMPMIYSIALPVSTMFVADREADAGRMRHWMQGAPSRGGGQLAVKVRAKIREVVANALLPHAAQSRIAHEQRRESADISID